MKEIKFKGKDIVGNWYEGNLAIIKHDIYNGAGTIKAGSYISNASGSPFAYQVRPETVGQYTGLKDKHGKMIFEGDVVLVEKFRKGVIIYLEKEALFAVDFSSHLSRLCDTTSDYIEIIGTIHDNPELLEVTE